MIDRSRQAAAYRARRRGRAGWSSAVIALSLCVVALAGAREASAGQLDLRWSSGSWDELGVAVERRTPPDAAFAEIARVGAAVGAFDDLAVTAGTEYCYRVVAFNAAGVSSPTEEICAHAREVPPPPVMPKLLVGVLPSSSGRGLIVTATVSPGDAPMPVDVYIVAQVPDGSLLSLTVDGRVVSGIFPIVQSFVPVPLSAEVFRHEFAGNEPAGDYVWIGALTRPDSLELIGDLYGETFTFSP
jgi:hypothetical protein